MHGVSVRKMRVFLAAVDEESFTKAAIRENISQPAATIIVNQIEEEVGAQLFERNGATRKAKLTELGVAVAETFARIVAAYDHELSRVSELASGRRAVRAILIQQALADCIETDWVSMLASLFPGDVIRVECLPRREILDRLQARDASVAILDGEIDGERFDVLALAAYRYVRLRHAAPLTSPPGVAKRMPCLVGGFQERGMKRAREAARTIADGPGEPQAGDLVETGSLRLAAAVLQQGGSVIAPDVTLPRLTDLCGGSIVASPLPTPETEIFLAAPRGGLGQLRLSALRGTPPFRTKNG